MFQSLQQVLIEPSIPIIIISEPRGTLGNILIGENETLNYSIFEIGQNISHFEECWFEYNNTEVLLNFSDTGSNPRTFIFPSNYANVTKVNTRNFANEYIFTNIPENCSRFGNFTVIDRQNGLSRDLYCLDMQLNENYFGSVFVSLIPEINITAMERRQLNCSLNTTEFEYVFNKNSLYIHAVDEFGLHSENDTSWDYLFIEGETEYNNNTYETKLESFYINISTAIDVINVNSILNYNGTQYTAVTDCENFICEISTAINIPEISSSQENITFFWEFIVFTGSTSQVIDSVNYSQNISEIQFEECGALTNETLVFTAFDEEDMSSISAFDFDGNFEYWLGTGEIRGQYNLSKENVNEVKICLEPTGYEFHIDADIEYDEYLSLIHI